ncbi:MAG: hypothetical protein LBD17_01680 [Endomicrobium sp.]|jgi:hypothetical protein|nr:hypothetical protein [Endomicrobium sp.]
MKKYLVFLLCLLFAAFVVSCKSCRNPEIKSRPTSEHPIAINQDIIKVGEFFYIENAELIGDTVKLGFRHGESPLIDIRPLSKLKVQNYK